jgi:hypothetical protein
MDQAIALAHDIRDSRCYHCTFNAHGVCDARSARDSLDRCPGTCFSNPDTSRRTEDTNASTGA